MYPSADEPKPQLLTMLQLRLLKKLGKNAYPFTFTVSRCLKPLQFVQIGVMEFQYPTTVEARPAFFSYIAACCK